VGTLGKCAQGPWALYVILGVLLRRRWLADCSLLVGAALPSPSKVGPFPRARRSRLSARPSIEVVACFGAWARASSPQEVQEQEFRKEPRGVQEQPLASTSAKGEVSAGNVGVPDLFLAPSFVDTSTLLTAETR
jgi:hypothetical protein